MTETRATIDSCVRMHPGIHFNDLVRSLELAPGQVQYHIKRLQSEEAIVVERVYDRTHYFPPDYGQWERRALALLRRETAGDVVAFLLENGPTRPGIVADELDIARSTLEWHLDRLAEHGLVEKQRDHRNHVTLAVAQPADTVRLLRDADPTLQEQLIDRFTRLVDQFLSE